MNTPPLNIAITGASGRMGKMLINTVKQADDMVLQAALTQKSNPFLNQHLQNVDCLIDFTSPDATLQYVSYCATHDIKMVIGTTGMSTSTIATIHKASEHIPIVMAPNTSIGVNVVLTLIAMAAPYFSHGYDIEIIEAHHRHKIDAPSGTALKMGDVIAAALSQKLEDIAVYTRNGVTGERHPSSIGFSSIRGGDIVGDHTVLFAGPGERIEITHKSSSRTAYAEGALQAARFLRNKTIGLYDMQDVLNLKALHHR